MSPETSFRIVFGERNIKSLYLESLSNSTAFNYIRPALPPSDCARRPERNVIMNQVFIASFIRPLFQLATSERVTWVTNQNIFSSSFWYLNWPNPLSHPSPVEINGPSFNFKVSVLSLYHHRIRFRGGITVHLCYEDRARKNHTSVRSVLFHGPRINLQGHAILRHARRYFLASWFIDRKGRNSVLQNILNNKLP